MKKPQLGMHRTYNPERLDQFAPANRAPNAWVKHEGACKDCGQPTTRSVTVGPPGHPEKRAEDTVQFYPMSDGAADYMGIERLTYLESPVMREMEAE